MFRRVLTAALLTAGFTAFAPSASASLIATIEGNDCAGAFGANFNECRVPAQYDLNQTPIIIKFDFDPNTPQTIEINSALFPTIDGTEFSFTGTGGASGTWTYNPGPGDPMINFFVAKGGPNFNLFRNLGDPLSDDWFTPLNPGENPPALSHLSFYDTTGDGKVPEPMPLALLGAGLLGLVLLRRRAR